MKTLSKVKLSRDFFQNSILVWNDKFRIDNFNRKIKIAKRDCDFSMPKKEARKQQLFLDSFRREKLDIKYPYKSFWHCQNYILNNLSKSQKKDFEKTISKIAFEKRQKKRMQATKKQVFEKYFS